MAFWASRQQGAGSRREPRRPDVCKSHAGLLITRDLKQLLNTSELQFLILKGVLLALLQPECLSAPKFRFKCNRQCNSVKRWDVEGTGAQGYHPCGWVWFCNTGRSSASSCPLYHLLALRHLMMQPKDLCQLLAYWP